MKHKTTIWTLLAILVLYSCNSGSANREFAAAEIALDTGIDNQSNIGKVETQFEMTIEFYELTTSSFGFLSKLGRAFVTGWNWLQAFLIGLIHLWPFLIIIGGGLFVAIRYGKKKRTDSVH